MRIITIPQFGIGDTLIATPAIKILKENLRDSHLTVLTMFKTTYQVLLHNPYINELIYIPFLKMGTFNSIKTLLKFRGKYEVSINFYPSNRYQYNIFAYIIGAKVRLGHRYIKYDLRSLNFLKNKTIEEDPEKHAVQENIALLKLLGIDVRKNVEWPLIYVETEEEKKWAREYLSNRGLLGKELIGFHTGSSVFKKHIYKRWPAQKFAALGDRLIESNPDRRILLFGGREDEDSIIGVLNGVKQKEKVLLVEGTTIRESASLIRMCKVFVSNDSGLMHLAASLGVPTVALFGPTNPKWVRPWGVKHRIIRLGLPCSPCFFYSPTPMDCHANLNYKCMKEIQVDTVLRETEALIEEGAR